MKKMPKICSFIILAIVITLCPGTVLVLFPSPVEALAPYLPSTQQKDNRTSRNIQRTYLSVVGDPSVHRAIPRNRRKRTLDHDAHNYPSSYNIKGLRLALKNANRNDDLGATTITTTNNNSSRRHLSKHKIILAKAAVVYLTSCILLAKLNLIGSDYTNLLIAKDFGVSLLTTILALIFVKSITKLAAEGILQARDSRKIIHMFSAPLFILFWPLFSDVWGARLFAAFVPALQALRLWFAGTGTSSSSSSDDGDVELNEMDDSTELANAISRSGDRQEALGGPFIYVVILFSAILLCFRDNLSGVVALSTMAAGDGMADIVGRRFGRNNKWFLNENKSVAGSVGFVVAASLCSTGLAAWLMYTHAVTIGLSMGVVVSRIVLISILSALVEILPGTDDNWSVPITAGVLSSLLID
jgi:Dolichol kinase